MSGIEKAAGSGIEKLFDYGAAITVLVLVCIGGAYLFRRLIDQCDKREERAVANWEKANERSSAAFERNTLVQAEQTIVLRGIQDRLRDIGG